MKIPISMRRNIVTGEITFEYAEVEEKVLIEFFEQRIKQSGAKN